MTEIISSTIVHPGELTEFPENSNTHPPGNIAELAESRRQFSQYKNAVVWSPPEETTVTLANGKQATLKPGIKYVLAGNGLHQASIKRGDEQIEVKDYSHLTYKQAVLLAEADNASALGSAIDPQQMQANLERARALYVDNERMAGMLERAKRLAGVNGNAGSVEDVEPEIDRAEELRQRYGVETGQVWELGAHRLICGDCTDRAVVEAVTGRDAPFMMVTDPPYGVSYDPKWREDYDQFERHSKGRVTNDDKIDWTPAYRLFFGDVAYVWHASWYTGLTFNNLISCGFQIRSSIIWRKQHFVFSRGHYHWQHEPCWYAVKKGRSARWGGDRTLSTIWDIQNSNPMGGSDRAGKSTHGTEKPIECMARPIRNHGEKDDIIYDPFLGSGTTLIACEQLNRRCRAVEIDPGYCAVAIHRWHELTGIEPKLIK
jgi:DNA modification methylase